MIKPQRAARLYNVALCAARLFLWLRQLYWSWLSRTLWAPWEMSQLYITPARVCVSAVMQTGTHTPTVSSPLLVLPFSLTVYCFSRMGSVQSVAIPVCHQLLRLIIELLCSPKKPSVLTLPSLHPARAQSKDVRPSKPETVTRLNNVSQPKLRAVKSNSIQSKPECERNTTCGHE